MFDKSTLYKKVVMLGKENHKEVPRTKDGMIDLVARTAATLNEEEYAKYPAQAAYDTQTAIGENYALDFEYFVKSINLVPKIEKRDFIALYFTHLGEEECRCILLPMFWFWNVTKKSDEYLKDTLRRF